MQFSETPSEIKIRHVPFLQWSIGICSIVLGATIVWLTFYPPLRFSGLLTQGVDWIDIIFLIVFAGYFGIFEGDLRGGILTPATTITLDRKGRFVQIDFIRVYGRHAERYYFSQVRKFRSQKKDVYFVSQYYLDLTLISGKGIKTRVPIGKDKAGAIKLVRKLNKIIKETGTT